MCAVQEDALYVRRGVHERECTDLQGDRARFELAYRGLITDTTQLCPNVSGELSGHITAFIGSLPVGAIADIIHLAHWWPLHAVLRGRTTTSDGTLLATLLPHDYARRDRLTADEQKLRGDLHSDPPPHPFATTRCTACAASARVLRFDI